MAGDDRIRRGRRRARHDGDRLAAAPLAPDQSARGYILNVFVEPKHRGQGLARALMDLAMEEARRRGLDHMILHATPMGRPLYEAPGWTRTSEMGLSLRDGG